MPDGAKLAALIALLALTGCAASQRTGQSTAVQFGVVREAQTVTLSSNVTTGAVVGGTIGLGRSSGGRPRSRRRANNVFVGVSAGSAAAAPSRLGVSYTVAMADGSTARVVSDQREIRAGDCVAVEQVRSTANIRRVSQDFCDAQNARAVREVRPAVRETAQRCAAAKDELVRASTDDEADLAARKIELLCDG